MLRELAATRLVCRGLSLAFAGLVAMSAPSIADAALIVPDTTYDLALTHRDASGNSLEDIRFQVPVGLPASAYLPGHFGYAEIFQFSEAEAELEDGRHELTFTLRADADLFPDFGQDDYGTGIAVGLLDPVDLRSPIRLTAAQLTYTDVYGDLVATASLLDGTVAASENPWSGLFPSGQRLIGFTNVFDRSVTTITLRLTAEDYVAAVPEPTSWALMIGGFGLIGGMMRRRPDTVRYAAA